MKHSSLFLLIILIVSSLYGANNGYSIIPNPKEFEPLPGQFKLTKATTFTSDTSHSLNAQNYLQEHLERSSHYTLQNARTTHSIIIYHQNTQLVDEAYQLKVTPKVITIEASSSAGFFYATVTLMQMMDPLIWQETTSSTPISSWKIAACKIEDAPRFKWRGMMLDCSRNFFSPAYVKKFIDRMAQHKLNVFHWHLSDDEGWRIEIKKYPLLTKVGSKRGPGTKLPFSLYPTMRGPKEKREEGYYSQEEIKEVVRYAQARSVNILPEIDVPAHAKAAVVAYADLLQDHNDTSHYSSVQKVSNNTMDPGLESTYLFLDNVIKELTTLFPFEYIHLGGDEVPKGAWKGSPSVQRLMRREGLKDNNEVQAYFFSRMDKILQKYHRYLIGWQEIRRDKSRLRDETIIMAWRGDGKGVKYANKGDNIIFSPAQYLYFDQQYRKAKNEYGHTWAGPTDTKEVYSYQPLHSKITPKNRNFVKGVHACLWSETALSEKIADYLIWPRTLAFSEVAWGSNQHTKWEDFKRYALPLGLERLRVQKVYFRERTP